MKTFKTLFLLALSAGIISAESEVVDLARFHPQSGNLKITLHGQATNHVSREVVAHFKADGVERFQVSIMLPGNTNLVAAPIFVNLSHAKTLSLGNIEGGEGASFHFSVAIGSKKKKK